ncbi:MAG: hypothetical protein C0391_08925 [Anaerolinea sp.]|nr:hypothetical protein [Anaerolinea sp.]
MQIHAKSQLFAGIIVLSLLVSCNFPATQPVTQIIPPSLSSPSVTLTETISEGGGGKANPTDSIGILPTYTDIPFVPTGLPTFTPQSSPEAADTAPPTSTVTHEPAATQTRTLLPSATKKPTKAPPTRVPQDAMIRIFQPATDSKVVSPLHLLAAVVPGDRGNVHLRVIGENGRVIVEKDWWFSYANNRRTTIDQKFDIQVEGVAESARVYLYTLDAQGRIESLASEDILLLSIGETNLAEAVNLLEPFQIASPIRETYIHHGVVKVYAIMRARSASLVSLELIDLKGVVVGSVLLPEILYPYLEYQVLDVTIPYQVRSGTWVRLTLRQLDPESKTDLAVSSLVIKVYP